jgi:hypothetical protein
MSELAVITGGVGAPGSVNPTATDDDVQPAPEVITKVYEPAPRFETVVGKVETAVEPVAAPDHDNVPVPVPDKVTEPVLEPQALGFEDEPRDNVGVGLTVTEIELLAVL